MNGTTEGAGTGGRRLLFVAANPSVDRLYEVDRLTAGEIHRPLTNVAVPGGKGLNAARAAATLGGSVTAVGIVAGRTGEWIAERLADLGLDARLTRTRGETRTCISILDRSSGALTELYERGDEIELAAWDALEATIVGEMERGDVAAVALSGSLPAGAPTDGFARIARLAGSMPRPIAVLVDTYGPALRSVLAERPAVVKVNATEAGEAGAIAVTDAASAVRAGDSLIAAGRRIRHRDPRCRRRGRRRWDPLDAARPRRIFVGRSRSAAATRSWRGSPSPTDAASRWSMGPGSAWRPRSRTRRSPVRASSTRIRSMGSSSGWSPPPSERCQADPTGHSHAHRRPVRSVRPITDVMGSSGPRTRASGGLPPEGHCPHGSTQVPVARRQSRHRGSRRWRLQRWREPRRRRPLAVARARQRLTATPCHGNGDADDRDGHSGGLDRNIRHPGPRWPHRLRRPRERWEPRLLDASGRDRHAPADDWYRKPPVRRVRSRWERIAYCADTSGAFEIWTMQPDGTQPAQLTHLGGRALFPDFSHDGKKVAFGGVQGDDPNTRDLRGRRNDRRRPRRAHELRGTRAAVAPTTTRSGRPTASPSRSSTPTTTTPTTNPINSQVWVMNADGSKPHALTTDSPMKDQVPDWSPDGSQIAYASGAVDSEGIWVMNADGSKPHQVSRLHARRRLPRARPAATSGRCGRPTARAIAFLRAFHGSRDRTIDPSSRWTPTAATRSACRKERRLAAVPAWQGSATDASD